MVFVNSMGDLFHEDCPDEWIDQVFAVMALCPQHTFQVLTKRSARMREYCQSRFETERGSELLCEAIEDIDEFNSDAGGDHDAPLPNVWLGVSVEDQQRADERIPDLLATPAAVRWISAEPLLGPVDITSIRAPRYTPEDEEIDWRFSCLNTGDYYWFQSGDYSEGGDGPYREAALDWVVAGGESGIGARGSTDEVEQWMRSLRDQCAAAGVPFFFKQWGEWGRVGDQDGLGHLPEDADLMTKVGKKRAGRLLDGVEHNAMPGQS
jgi:protein gp37